jgi:hypothetical protein
MVLSKGVKQGGDSFRSGYGVVMRHCTFFIALR